MSGDAPAATESVNALEAAVANSLDELRTFRFRWWAPVLLGIIMLFDSWDASTIGYVAPVLAKEWHLSPIAMGSLMSAGYAGQLVGAILLGGVAERYGRMRVFLFAIITMCLFGIICAFSPSYETLLPARFLQGIAIGGALPVSITYINELAPTSTRGRYFGTFQFLCMAGYSAASVSSTMVIPTLGWRWMFGLGALPLLLLPLVVMTLPESPRWLARAGRRRDAEQAMAKLGARGFDLGLVPDDGASVGKRSPRIPISSLFGSRYGARTTLLVSLWFLVSFAALGLSTWAPSIYVTVFHFPVEDALRYVAFQNLTFLLVSPSVALLLDKVGRRPLAITGTLISTIALMILGFFTPSGTLALVVLVIAGQLGVALASVIIWPYTAENYPTPMRAVALGFTSSFARAASMLTPLFVGLVLGMSGSVQIVFIAFGLCALVAMLLWVFATHETTNVRLEQL